MFLAIMAAESPEGTNLEACVGGMLSINMDADVKIAYTPPVG